MVLKPKSQLVSISTQLPMVDFRHLTAVCSGCEVDQAVGDNVYSLSLQDESFEEDADRLGGDGDSVPTLLKLLLLSPLLMDLHGSSVVLMKMQMQVTHYVSTLTLPT